MERSPKEWEALVMRFKSRISAMKSFIKNEQMEVSKKTLEEIRESNRNSASKS